MDGQTIATTILVERASGRPLSAKQQSAAQAFHEGGLPDSPLGLCKSLWEIYVEAVLAEEFRGVNRERAYRIMEERLAAQGLST